MDFKIIYEDKDLLVIDKPARIDVVELGEELLKTYPELKTVERNGLIHRLDKNTSGVILVARTSEALIFFQKQFINRGIEKKYLALVSGRIDGDRGEINALIGRSPKDRTKQKVYLLFEPGAQNQRGAITEYRVVKRLESEDGKEFTLVEAHPKTGRKHQIRVHLAHVHHPIAGDEMYGFKGQACPKDLTRQFLHASYIKIQMPNGEIKEFNSGLAEDLKQVISNLYDQNTNI
jgi:23S rRNA pseudouridine1911/1915/1917 synthase